ncbi:hypothetical protein JTB14_028982 [Gonioctena quinquepunctata]|nr:hypothetical protein JTB14_028982 [Gonioctena quinquepunctata]
MITNEELIWQRREQFERNLTEVSNSQIIYRCYMCKIEVRQEYLDCGIENCEAIDSESTISSCGFHPIAYTRPEVVTLKITGNQCLFNASILF